MNFSTIVVALLIIIGVMYVSANWESWVSNPNSEYCKEYQEKANDSDYMLSYNERTRAVSEGCIEASE